LSAIARRTGWTALTALLLAGCAAPPLKLYTLAGSSVGESAQPLTRGAAVIEVDRLVLPDDVDSQDILVRNGDVMERSDTGRWVSRLSRLATELVTSRLAMRAPAALVTDSWPDEPPNYRVIIRVARMDIASNGLALLVADWQVSARDPGESSVRGRAQIRLSGPTAMDADIVRLETALFERLADTIVIPRGFTASDTVASEHTP